TRACNFRCSSGASKLTSFPGEQIESVITRAPRRLTFSVIASTFATGDSPTCKSSTTSIFAIRCSTRPVGRNIRPPTLLTPFGYAGRAGGGVGTLGLPVPGAQTTLDSTQDIPMIPSKNSSDHSHAGHYPLARLNVSIDACH